MKAKFKESAVKQLKIQDVTYDTIINLEKYGYDKTSAIFH